MRNLVILRSLFVILLLAFTAGGTVNAKLHSIPQFFSLDLHYAYDGNGNVTIGRSHILSQYANAGQLLYPENHKLSRRTDYVYPGNRPIAYHERPLFDGPGYTGYVQDAATGLTYMQRRYYDPAIGRFLSVDPVAADPITGSNFNRYCYANNNPYRFYDPEGLCPGSRLQDPDGDCTFTDDSTTQTFEGDYFFDGTYVSPETIAQSRRSHPHIWGDPAIGEANQNVLTEAAISAIPGAAIIRVLRTMRMAVYVTRGVKALPAPRARGNPNAVPERGPIYVDSKGNAIPTPPGGRITGSPDGRFIQARDAAGNPTGVRIDGPHKPASHPDPRAQQPHGHVPGVTNPDGTPWLPIRQ